MIPNNVSNSQEKKKFGQHCIDCNRSYPFEQQYCPKCHNKNFPIILDRGCSVSMK